MLKRKLICTVLVFALVVPSMASGCNKVVKEDEPGVASSAVTEMTEAKETLETIGITEPSAEEADAEPFVFEPHVKCELLSEIVTDEMWDSFYNMVDAIRAGEDTFECADEKAYEWCTHECTLGSFLPAACTHVVGDGYEYGKAKLEYKMDKDEFLEREQKFEEEIVRMLNEATRSDYSDFEKLITIYDYVCKNFQYDFTNIDGEDADGFGTYACLMTKEGICCEIAGAMTYLLLQTGVQAMDFGGQGSSGFHSWNYVLIGGRGYHVDATWALHGESPDTELCLQYFMMTERERADGYFEDFLQADLIWFWKTDYDLARFSATDPTFRQFHNWASYEGIDTAGNVVFYADNSGEHCELSYGDM